MSEMRYRFIYLLILSHLLFVSAPLTAQSDDLSDEEEKEIVQMIDMFANYDLIKSLDMYEDMENIDQMNNEENTAGGDAGGSEVGK